jgi:hypothetical protein
MQSVVDEIELLLLESGMEAVFKHIPGQAMTRLHVDGASRRNPPPLMDCGAYCHAGTRNVDGATA